MQGWWSENANIVQQFVGNPYVLLVGLLLAVGSPVWGFFKPSFLHRSKTRYRKQVLRRCAEFSFHVRMHDERRLVYIGLSSMCFALLFCMMSLGSMIILIGSTITNQGRVGVVSAASFILILFALYQAGKCFQRTSTVFRNGYLTKHSLMELASLLDAGYRADWLDEGTKAEAKYMLKEAGIRAGLITDSPDVRYNEPSPVPVSETTQQET